MKQLHRVGLVALEQREHLRMIDARARGEPLHIPTAEARRRPQGIRVVEQPATHHRDGLEPPVRVLGKTGHHGAVIHVPAVPPIEVLAQVAARQRGGRPEALVPMGYLSSWWTQKRNGSGVRHGIPSGSTRRTASGC